jgi:hypothetical protein
MKVGDGGRKNEMVLLSDYSLEHAVTMSPSSAKKSIADFAVYPALDLLAEI